MVDLSEVWKKLDTKSTVWTLLIDDQAKLLTVSEYIDRFQKQGVKINEPPEHYVQMIDQIVTGKSADASRPFGELVQIVAIVDYDFDNGMDKDDLARKVLGEAGFEANKKRFTQQQQSAEHMKKYILSIDQGTTGSGLLFLMHKAVSFPAPIRNLNNIILSPAGLSMMPRRFGIALMLLSERQ